MNFLDNDFPEVTEAYHGSLEDWLELFERYAFPRTGDTETSLEMKRIFKRYHEVTYEDWLDIVIKCARDEIWYEEKINLSIRELYLVVNKVVRLGEKLRAAYNRQLLANNLVFESTTEVEAPELDTAVTIDKSSKVEIKDNLYTLAIPFKTLGDFYRSLPIGRQSGIYIIKLNKPNKLPAYYVGKSVDIRYRIQTHFRAPVRDSKKLHNAIRKYPADYFEIGVLEFVSPNDLNTREIYWITELDLCNSYDLNLTHGGDGASRYKITPQIHDEIADLLLTSDLPLSKIAANYGVTSKVISQINQGMHWCSSPEKYEYNPAIRSIERSQQIKQKAYQDSLNNKVILWQKTEKSSRSKLLGTFNSLMKAAKYIEQYIKADKNLYQQLEAKFDNPKLLDNIQTALGRGLREVGKDGLPRGWYMFYVTPGD